MALNEYFTDLYRELAEIDVSGLTDEEKAARSQEFIADFHSRQEAPDATGVAVADTEIGGPHGPIPLRTYRPEGSVGAALLWAHGGGFFAGDLDMLEAHMVSIELARRAGALVVSVDYRLAVDGVRYPVPIDDVKAAWDWLCGQELPDGAPIALGGASAGAALALATALRARDDGPRPVDALLLAYPFAHFPNPTLDAAVNERMSVVPFRFDTDSIETMVRNYVGRISDVPPDALPGAARLDGLPPTRIVAAEYDDLRASAELLERQLREVGVPVESYLAEGMPHGHLNHPVSLPEVGRTLDFFAKGLTGA